MAHDQVSSTCHMQLQDVFVQLQILVFHFMLYVTSPHSFRTGAIVTLSPVSASLSRVGETASSIMVWRVALWLDRARAAFVVKDANDASCPRGLEFGWEFRCGLFI